MIPENKINSKYFMSIFNDIFICDPEFSVKDKILEKPNHRIVRNAVYMALNKKLTQFSVNICTTSKFAKYIKRMSEEGGFVVTYKKLNDDSNVSNRYRYNFTFKW